MNVDANNRQLHPDQVALVKQKARQLDGADGKSASQWEKELTQQLLYQNDVSYQGFGNNPNAAAILSELERTSGISMTATGRDYLNSAMNSDTSESSQQAIRLPAIPETRPSILWHSPCTGQR